MKITRKDFLRGLGLTALAAGCGKAVAHLAASDPTPLSGTKSGSPGTAASGEAAANHPPAARPRWGMAVDFKKCSTDKGCEDCILACDRAHNIPNIPEPAHEVKWIWKEDFEKVFPFQQNDYTRTAYAGHPLALLCQHCAEPPCTKVCPTKATWKREDGIVMMDYHRCIGCRYCMAACPYGSRSFNFLDPRPYIAQINADFPTRTKGVVEKCNFCEERLVKGQKPACVDACPEKALVFGDLNDPNSEIRKLLQARYAIQRKPELGTGPSIYYLI